MSVPVASWWFTALEIAQLGLPGLPDSKRRVHDWAVAEGWTQRTSADGAPLARRRAARGGGVEYHVSLLPVAAQEFLAARRHREEITPVAANDEETAAAGRWAWFEQQTAATKAKAEARLAILVEIETMVVPEAGVVRPVRHRGQTAAALKPIQQVLPEAAEPAFIDAFTAGTNRLRIVE